MRTWKNARGEGTIMSIDLVDREGTMIQATGFKDVAQRLASEVQENKVYTFANGAIKVANKRYTSIKNDYCITFDSSTVIKECAEDKGIKGDGFSFTPLKDIESIHQQCTIDVIGVVLEVNPIAQIQMRDGAMKDKQTMVIGDESNVSIPVTLWGDACNANLFREGLVVAFRGCRVSDYQGKSLNASGTPGDVIVNMQKNVRAIALSKFSQEKSASKMKSEMRALGGIQGEGGSKKSALTIEEA